MATPTAPNSTSFESWSEDLVSAAGLQNIDVTVDAEATVAATSTAKSASTSENVTGDSGSLADLNFNSGLQASASGTNAFDIASDAGLSGIATSTVTASAVTSAGEAEGFATIGDSAGISDVSELTVGGELTALGKAVGSISGSAETVVGDADATGWLEGTMQGFQAADIGISSDAGIQGLAQLTNSATAAATSAQSVSDPSAATAEAYVNNLTGASLDDLVVGGVAAVAGQASLGNTSKATNVVGEASATSQLVQATGLKATTGVAAGIDVASDATITGLSSITSSATAATTAGLADATSIGGSIQGIQIEDAQIGGVASITGQTNFTGNAKSSNVTDGNSIATSNLAAAGGLDANELVDVSSDATLKGLTSINMSAMAESTGSSEDPTNATATFDASNITGADLDAVTIGGVGNLLGQVGFNASASASNVTGNATSGGGIDPFSSPGIETVSGLTSDAHTEIKSDGTIKGIASVTSSASAETTDGVATAINLAASLEGAALVSTTIGGVGDLLGQVGFTGASAATNVSGDANSATGAVFADGLTTAALTDIKSDGTLKGLASINSSASAETTAGTAISEAAGVYVQGASLNTVEIGGVGNVLGQAGITSAAQANSVTGDAFVMPTGGFEADGLVTDGSMTVMSDATLKGIASVTGSATATTTDGVADATAFGATINGADFGDLVDIGGVGSIKGAASFNLSAKSTNVTGESSTATALAFDAVGLEGINGDATPDELIEAFGIDVASDATLSGTAIGTLKGEAFSTASTTLADVGNGAGLTGANIGDLNVGGVANVTGAAQLTGTGLAQNVGGDSASATANVGLAASVTGLSGLPTGDDDALESFINVASDATVTAQAFGTLNATATSTGGDATAMAGNGGTELTGLASGLDLNIGGVGTLSALAQGAESATATTVDGIATASAGMDLLGAQELNFQSSSDGSLTGIAKLAATASASSTGADASANGNFSAIGFDNLVIGTLGDDGVAGIGGVSTLKGQAQITGTLSAESVSGDAFAGSNEIPSTITGFDGLTLNGASDGTILGTASGVFNTTASSTLGDASGFSAQNLTGISSLNLELGGNGTINAIVTDTNFVTAHSVSGNATAVASVNAIGLDGGTIHIAGNATIMSNVNVDSKAESHTIGG